MPVEKVSAILARHLRGLPANQFIKPRYIRTCRSFNLGILETDFILGRWLRALLAHRARHEFQWSPEVDRIDREVKHQRSFSVRPRPVAVERVPAAFTISRLPL